MNSRGRLLISSVVKKGLSYSFENLVSVNFPFAIYQDNEDFVHAYVKLFFLLVIYRHYTPDRLVEALGLERHVHQVYSHMLQKLIFVFPLNPNKSRGLQELDPCDYSAFLLRANEPLALSYNSRI